MDALTLPPTTNWALTSARGSADDAGAARLALTGDLRVLDGGNRFNVSGGASCGAIPRADLRFGASNWRGPSLLPAAGMLAEMPADARRCWRLTRWRLFMMKARVDESRRLLAAASPICAAQPAAPVVVSARPPAAPFPERRAA